MKTETDKILCGQALCKDFPGVRALDDVSIAIQRGEILGICGENGAGKSTLMKLFSGVYAPDTGRIFFEGREVRFRTPAESIRAGICIIHQELSYIGELSVAENIFQERLPQKRGLIDWKRLYRDADAVLKKFDIKVSSKSPMRDLPMAAKQLIEIVKASSSNAKVVIMDEPTSSLGIDETKKLFDIIHDIQKEGVTVLIISHRLEELFEISDRLIVMRDGCIVGEFERGEYERSTVIRTMIGREMTQLYPKLEIPLGESVLEYRQVSSATLHDISFSVRSGEIVGLYGMVGSGQDEILEAAFGMEKILSGDLLLLGKKLSLSTPRDAVASGIAYLTAERKRDGLVLIHSVESNTALASMQDTVKNGLVNDKRMTEIARGWKERLGIKTQRLDTVVGTLSGGNQQKVVLAKWLQTQPKVLLMNEPTRGVDVGAKQEMYSIIQALCKAGMAVVMITSDMMEMLNVADTIYTVWDGRITARYDKEEATQYQLMLSAIGMEDKAQ